MKELNITLKALAGINAIEKTIIKDMDKQVLKIAKRKNDGLNEIAKITFDNQKTHLKDNVKYFKKIIQEEKTEYKVTKKFKHFKKELNFIKKFAIAELKKI